MRGKDIVRPSMSSASSSLLNSASPISGSSKSSGLLAVMAVVAAALAFIIDIKDPPVCKGSVKRLPG